MVKSCNEIQKRCRRLRGACAVGVATDVRANKYWRLVTAYLIYIVEVPTSINVKLRFFRRPATRVSFVRTRSGPPSPQPVLRSSRRFAATVEAARTAL